MTRRTAERRVKKALAGALCRGPMVLSEDERLMFEARWEAEKDVPALVDKLLRDLEGYLEELVKREHGQRISLRSPAIDWLNATSDQVWDRVHRLILARGADVGLPCGEPVVNVVLAGPFDGQEHEYICPGCKRPGTYRAPWFEGLNE